MWRLLKENNGNVAFLRRQINFNSVNDKGYSFGEFYQDTSEDAKPEGWVASGPYAGDCYCPDCWAKIEVHEAEEDVL